MNKGVELVTLTKIEGANLSSDGTEGVISVLKKVKDPVDMKEYVRVSGQSVKYQLRQILREIVGDDKISNLTKMKGERGEGKVIVSEGDPVNYVDDDLFGYMVTGKNIKRTAPVRTNGLVSIFPYMEDRDFGVRYDSPEVEGYNPKEPEHNIHETEIATNIMRGNFFIELDRVGEFTNEEVSDPTSLDTNVKESRVKDLINAILSYHGGAHLTRFFTKVYPEAAIVVLLNRKIPAVGDNFKFLRQYSEDKKYYMDVKLLKEVLETFDEFINKVYLGVIESKFENLDEIKELNNDKIEVLSLKDLKTKITEEKIVG